MKNSFFNTIKFKVFFSVTALIAAVVALCIVLSTAFSEDYFLYRVTKSLGSSYREIYEICSNSALSPEERATEIEKLCNNNNIHTIVFKENEILYSSLPRDSARFIKGSSEQDTESKAPESNKFKPVRPPRTDDQNTKQHPPKDEDKRKVLTENSEYRITSSYITPFDSYNLELTGTKDSLRIVIQCSAAAISENIRIFNTFFIMLGIFAIIFAGIFAYIISRRFTAPIHKLSGIAKRMSELDFSQKYDGKGTDELGLLGDSINTLSEKLKKTIGELKSANLKLMQDIDIKEKTDLQRREFLSGVSHELKTPISIIEAYAEGLCEMELSDEDRKYYCEVIADEAGKMNTLIVKLMSLMELESGSDKIELERYNITEQLQNLMEDKKVLFEQSGTKPFLLSTKDCFVWGDAFLIEEALINYLVNAMKYSSGEKIIKIWTEQKEDKVRVNIYNSGSRIPENELENIWNSFYKVDKARTRDGGSRGLGLSIVRAIALAHGGACGAENTPDGVIFWLEIDKA